MPVFATVRCKWSWVLLLLLSCIPLTGCPPSDITLPDFTGQARTAVESAIAEAELVLGSLTEAYSDTVPAGVIISQDPPAGESIDPETPVNLVVSLGPQPATVPNAVGMARATAESRIRGARLVVGGVTEEHSDTVPAGTVISQDPAANSTVEPGTAINLVVSAGRAPVNVPNVTGLAQAAAQTVITGAGLTVGIVTQTFSNTIPMNQVISQNPAAGTSVPPGSTVALVVSRGSQPVSVPDVVNMTQTAAQATITGADLTLGAVTHAYSDTVSIGQVISQNPVPGTTVLPGSTVALVISQGPAPVAVPNVLNMTRTAAQAALTGAGLAVGTVTQAYSGTVPVNNVISQNPVAGTLLPPGNAVALIISQGPAPVTVPNVLNMTQAAAQTTITGAGLTVGEVTQAHSATVPTGQVVSQTPAVGTFLPPGSAVALVISQGPPPVAVPNVLNMTQTAAQTAITAAGLALGEVTQAYSATVPAGQVVSQTPAAGTLLPPGSSVSFAVSQGPRPVTVPDVVDMEQSLAETAITNAALALGEVARMYSSTIALDHVISQDPTAGTVVPPATPVSLVVSDGPQPVTVPNVVDMEQAAAESAITSAALALGEVTRMYSSTVLADHVISQNPAAGTSVPPATPVALEVSKGLERVPVPDLSGLTRIAARQMITGARLYVGNETEEYHPAIPVDHVISQTPPAGTLVEPGLFVNMIVSRGPQPIIVPNVVNMPQANAQAAITGAGLAVGGVTQAYSATIAVGNIVSQNPAAGTSVLPGTAVSLVVSLGPVVPNVVNMPRPDARSAITAAGLSVGEITEEYNPAVLRDHVISQNPAAGTPAPQGSAVSLLISKGPSPVTINSIEELQRIGNEPGYPLHGNYLIGQDIDASVTAGWNSGAGFAPIGSPANAFCGTLNGQNHIVTDLVVNRPAMDNVGLFSHVTAAGIIENLVLEDETASGGVQVGGLAGSNQGAVTNCRITGSFTGPNTVGGLVGFNMGAVTDCDVAGDIFGSNAGGLLGVNDGNVLRCHADCPVTGTGFMGGLIGVNRSGVQKLGKVTACSATGNVSGWGNVMGGLIGRNMGGTITDCHALGQVSSSGQYTPDGNGWAIGGLVGFNDIDPIHQIGGVVQKCHATGNVSGSYSVGGLVGENEILCEVDQGFATGAVTGDSYVGGLAGRNWQTITNSCAAGAVTGETNAGGLLGKNEAIDSLVSRCHSTGPVSGADGYGDLVRGNGGNVQYSYWDMESSGLETSIGGGTGKTTAEMMTKATFAGWDFTTIWDIEEGATYPFLRALNLGTITTPGVVGGTESNAETVIAAAGLTITDVTRVCDPRIPLGQVMRQAPPRGTRVPEGAGMTLVVSLGPIQISTIEQLQRIGGHEDYPLDGNYVVTQDIDASATAAWNNGLGFLPIGVFWATFTGTLDGNGHVITGLRINQFPGGSDAGLIGCLGDGGTVKNLGLENASISGENQIGGLAGRSAVGGTIENCYVTGTVTGIGNVGGMVGVHEGILLNSFTTASVTGSNTVGGLVGINLGGSVTNCYAAGAVSGVEFFGGLIGVVPGTTVSSYWDTQTTGQSVSAAGTGLPTTEMMTQSTFNGWDFADVWGIVEGETYPFLRLFNGG